MQARARARRAKTHPELGQVIHEITVVLVANNRDTLWVLALEGELSMLADTGQMCIEVRVRVDPRNDLLIELCHHLRNLDACIRLQPLRDAHPCACLQRSEQTSCPQNVLFMKLFFNTQYVGHKLDRWCLCFVRGRKLQELLKNLASNVGVGGNPRAGTEA